ncbi:MAG: hypothetical protein HYY52_05680 [Candidatus Melainabacteria bacterium]|nr:hypothetical protein [Candidatus Melainabacteria bacterium]
MPGAVGGLDLGSELGRVTTEANTIEGQLAQNNAIIVDPTASATAKAIAQKAIGTLTIQMKYLTAGVNLISMLIENRFKILERIISLLRS